MVKSYYLAGAASAVCVILIAVAVSSTVYILHDISEFYTEAQEELVEFKEIANNVWDYVTYDASPEEMREAEEHDKELDERMKRSYESGSYDANPVSTTPSTTTSTTTQATTTASVEEMGYDSITQDTGPPSSRPRKPMPPTMPRTIQGIQGFKAPPPAATSTYRPPTGGNYDNYGRDPASSKRPYQPATITSSPYSPSNPLSPRHPSNPNQTHNPQNPSNTRAPYNSRYTQAPRQPHNSNYDETPETTQQPYGPSSYYPPRNNQQQPRHPQRPDYPGTLVKPPPHGSNVYPAQRPNPPVTPPPRQPNGGYDGDRQTPPTWPSSYNTRRPNGPGGEYPEDRLSPSTPNPIPRPPHTREPWNERPENPDRTSFRPGFGPTRPRGSTNQRPRANQCDMCGKQPNNCPAGPPGPRGRPGPPGFPGQDGPRGLRGLNGGHVGVNPASYDPVIGCVQCPIGPPGERGLDGPQGPPGEDGVDGEQGANGNDGQPGTPGTKGYPGQNGIPGKSGKPGTPGRNGQACRSMPGPPGAPGTTGVPGRPGDPGIDGEHGQDGSPGIQGPPGIDGRPGLDGPQGVSAPGPPGSDGGYCPCPKRSSKYDFSDGYTDEERKTGKHPPPKKDHSMEIGEGKRRPYGDENNYEQTRKPNYDNSMEMPVRRNRYEDQNEQKYEEDRPVRKEKMEVEKQHGGYERRPNNMNEYENEAPRGGYGEETRTRPYDNRERTPMRNNDNGDYQDRGQQRPSKGGQRYDMEAEVADRRRPLKKVEIPKHYENEERKTDNGYEMNGGDRDRQRAYNQENESSFEEDSNKQTHPPGIRYRRPEHEETEKKNNENRMPDVKKTERYEGDKKQRTSEYEDISKTDEEKEQRKEEERHHRKPNKFQEKQWEEHRKSQELRNSREKHSIEDVSEMEPVHPKEYSETPQTSYGSVERSHTPSSDNRGELLKSDSYAPSSGRPVYTETALPSEQLPYRRRHRFYRNNYYEKYLL